MVTPADNSELNNPLFEFKRYTPSEMGRHLPTGLAAIRSDQSQPPTTGKQRNKISKQDSQVGKATTGFSALGISSLKHAMAQPSRLTVKKSASVSETAEEQGATTPTLKEGREGKKAKLVRRMSS